MATTTTSKKIHTSVIPWEDVKAKIVDNSENLMTTKPSLTVTNVGIGIMGGMALSGVRIAWDVTPQALDGFLREEIKDLPTLGLYVIQISPNNDLSVSWEEEVA